MSPSLPVPSKAALRTLRHIALGTSCTIAFGAGLMTEDRRRRIHTARQVCENGRRLKKSRRYHTAESWMSTALQERVENNCQDGVLDAGEMLGVRDRNWSGNLPNTTQRTPKLPPKPKVNTSSRIEPIVLPRLGKMNSDEIMSWIPAKIPALERDDEAPIVEASNNAAKIPRTPAQEIREILEMNPDAAGVNAAIAIVSEALTTDILRCPPVECLVNACELLARASVRYDVFDKFIPVLQKILSFGCIDEESFYKLHGPMAAGRLLAQSGYTSDFRVVTNVEKLKESTALFLAGFHERPELFPPEMRQVGIDLCDATYRAKLYKQTITIYWHLNGSSNNHNDVTSSEIASLILASYESGYHKKVHTYFVRFFAHAKPESSEFYPVVSAVVDSALQGGRFDKAEEILAAASQIQGKYLTSTKLLLRVLGEHWRSARDISKTRALFDRLEGLVKHSDHPQAIYSAMIQFCVESGKESDVPTYLDRFLTTNGGRSLDVRTCGHLALAKAMKNDWVGVKADFTLMKSLRFNSASEYSQVFVPILKAFAICHDVPQIEDFVRYYIDELGVAPNSYVSNIMIDAYCKAGELSFIPKWIEYMRQHELELDVVTFNTILSSCRKVWAMHFDDLFQLCEQTKSIASSMINFTTMDILRDAAITAATGDSQLATRLLGKLRSIQPSADHLQRSKVSGILREALSAGQPTKALQIYKQALEAKVPITPQILDIAVSASLQTTVGDELGCTVDLLYDAKSRGIDVYLSMVQLLLHQVERSKGNSEAINSVIKHSVFALEKRGFEVTLRVASKVIGALVGSGRSRQAIWFWTSLSRRTRAPPESIDLVLLTVLLRAYLSLSDCAGIRWVMKILALNRIIPDMHFKLVLKNFRREARRKLDANPHDDRAKERFTLLDESIEVVISQRSRGLAKRKEAEEMTLSIIEPAATLKGWR